MGIMSVLGLEPEEPQKRRVRYAVVGAGWIAQAVFMPGVAQTENSVLTALVTGDPKKARLLAEKYGIDLTYSYDEYDQLLADDVADAVYIATPNFDHASYALRALSAGVHVLLEKPVEISVERAEHIRTAAERAKRQGAKLMVAYRLHFEPATLDALKRIRNGEIGEPISFSSQFSQHVSPGNHRARSGFDAGPVADMGPYPINAVRNLFGEEPIEVSAVGSRHPEARLGDFDDTVAVTLRFPSNRLAQFVVSYAGHAFGSYQVIGTKGVLEMSSAYSFESPLEQRRTIEEEKPKLEKFGAVGQFAGETSYFSTCILDDRNPEPDAEEGMLDVRVIEASRRALETGYRQQLAPYTRARRRARRIDTETQKQTRPVHKPPALVNAHAPEES